METLCTLCVVAGDDERCPRGWCAFWERGGAVVGPGCAIDRLGIRIDDPQLARHLLDLRRELETVRDAEAAEEAGRHLAALTPPDVAGA
jgi:hypothetical protein